MSFKDGICRGSTLIRRNVRPHCRREYARHALRTGGFARRAVCVPFSPRETLSARRLCGRYLSVSIRIPMYLYYSPFCTKSQPIEGRILRGQNLLLNFLFTASFPDAANIYESAASIALKRAIHTDKKCTAAAKRSSSVRPCWPDSQASAVPLSVTGKRIAASRRLSIS